jgi:hypothetical protein
MVGRCDSATVLIPAVVLLILPGCGSLGFGGGDGWVMVDLTLDLNNGGFSSAEAKWRADFDGYGNSYSDRAFGEERPVWVVVDGVRVPFARPPVHVADDNVTCGSQRIRCPPGNYNVLYAMGAATEGKQSGNIVLHYAGRDALAELAFSDWCGRAGDDEVVVCESPRHSTDEEVEDATCRVFARKIPLNGSRELLAISLPENAKLHVFAITLME